MSVIAMQCLIILAVFYFLYRYSETPLFASHDIRPTANIIFLYFFMSMVFNETGITSKGGFFDAKSGYYLIAWNCAYHCYFAYLLLKKGCRLSKASILVMSFFIELNIALFLDFYGGKPYPMIESFEIMGITTHAYQALIFIFNMLFIFVFALPIVDLSKRGFMWLKDYLYSLLPHGSSQG